MSTITPTLSELLRKVIDSRIAEVHVSFPAKVESYDAEAQTVDVQPMVRKKLVGVDQDFVADLPVLTAVPVAFPRGGGFFLSFPIQRGDFVFVVCSDYDHSEFIETGRLSSPPTGQAHSLIGAVAIPAVYPKSGALSSASGENLVIGNDSGAKLTIKSDSAFLETSGEINLGSESAADFVALATATNNSLQALKAAFDGHMHVTTATIGPSAAPGIIAPPTPSGTVPPTLQDVTASKVKAD